MPRSAHIAMVGTPLVGHVLPSLEIIRELVARGHRVTYANAGPVADWLTGCGAVTRDVEEFAGHPERVLAMTPRALQPHAERVDTEAVTFVGPCLGVARERDGWTRPAGAKKVLLVSLAGSAHHGA